MWKKFAEWELGEKDTISDPDIGTPESAEEGAILDYEEESTIERKPGQL